MSDQKATGPVAQLVDEVVQTMRAGQAMGMQVLLAEMQALQAMLPGVPMAAETGEAAKEAEAAFDNMPV
jgi:hypothetical protein